MRFIHDFTNLQIFILKTLLWMICIDGLFLKRKFVILHIISYRFWFFLFCWRYVLFFYVDFILKPLRFIFVLSVRFWVLRAFGGTCIKFIGCHLWRFLNQRFLQKWCHIRIAIKYTRWWKCMFFLFAIANLILVDLITLLHL